MELIDYESSELMKNIKIYREKIENIEAEIQNTNNLIEKYKQISLGNILRS
jgi:uncharacterized protein YukE